MPGESDQAIGAKRVRIVAVAACRPHQFAADFTKSLFKLAATPRRIPFSPGLGGQDKFITKRRRNRPSRLEQRLQMRFGHLLETQNRFAPVAPVRVATGKQFAFCDEEAVLVAADLNLRYGNDHDARKLIIAPHPVNGG